MSKKLDSIGMNRERKLRVGVIGGGWGVMHILGFHVCEDVEVVAFCQRTPPKAESIAQEFHISARGLVSLIQGDESQRF